MWKKEAEQLKFDEHKSWAEIVEELKHYFPKKTDIQVRETIRAYIRRLPRYKEQQREDFHQSSIEYKKDGSIISEKFITVRDGDEMTPEFIIEAHGLKPCMWEVVSYKNNFWNTQIKGGSKQISYQSKLTVKPRSKGIDISEIDKYFEKKKFKYDKPLTNPLRYDPKGEVIEINLPDLHSGLLAWRKETGTDYDIHITKDRFFKCLYDIKERCEGKKFKKIIFVTLGDLLHFDNDNQTTSKGTFQQADGRLAKIFDATLDMLIDGITLLGEIAPVEVIYIKGNHDEVTGYTLLKATEKAFRNDKNITFDTEPNPQKFKLIGKVLIGWTHGNMPKQNMGAWLQGTAKKEYGQSEFAEVHAGHFHSQKVIEKKPVNYNQTDEQNGIVIRYLPTISSASYWEHRQGYAKNVKTVMSFIWNEKTGLRAMWYSNI
ncbi:MAG: hypothetical protein PHE79_05020 [Eubacteriales bacterium]|nr:hypothetical protein [Eubacteriales bacterium]